jgi:hypothetical protein
VQKAKKQKWQVIYEWNLQSSAGNEIAMPLSFWRVNLVCAYVLIGRDFCHRLSESSGWMKLDSRQQNCFKWFAMLW